MIDSTWFLSCKSTVEISIGIRFGTGFLAKVSFVLATSDLGQKIAVRVMDLLFEVVILNMNRTHFIYQRILLCLRIRILASILKHGVKQWRSWVVLWEVLSCWFIRDIPIALRPEARKVYKLPTLLKIILMTSSLESHSFTNTRLSWLHLSSSLFESLLTILLHSGYRVLLDLVLILKLFHRVMVTGIRPASLNCQVNDFRRRRHDSSLVNE